MKSSTSTAINHFSIISSQSSSFRSCQSVVTPYLSCQPLTPYDNLKFLCVFCTDPAYISSWFSCHNSQVAHQKISCNIASLPCDYNFLLSFVELSKPLGSRYSLQQSAVRTPGGYVGSLKINSFQACRAARLQQHWKHWKQYIKTRNTSSLQRRKG